MLVKRRDFAAVVCLPSRKLRFEYFSALWCESRSFSYISSELGLGSNSNRVLPNVTRSYRARDPPPADQLNILYISIIYIDLISGFAIVYATRYMSLKYWDTKKYVYSGIDIAIYMHNYEAKGIKRSATEIPWL